MKKQFLFLSLICTLIGGTLFAEKHTLGFAALDVDINGTNYTKVYYMIEGSPAAGTGGFQMGDTILSINGLDVADKYWREVSAYLKSDKPTTFSLSVLRNNQTINLKITSVPASSQAGKKHLREDPKKINPNLRDVIIPISTNRNRILGDPTKIIGKQVYVKIRYAGENWWIYNKPHQLNSEDKFNGLNLKLTIDYTRTLYIEMVYQSTDGLWHGDYIYMTGDHAVWGNGYNRAKLMIWHTFDRNQSDPDWDKQLNRKIDVKAIRTQLVLSNAGYKYYSENGYIFADEAKVTIIDVHGKKISEKTIPVNEKWGWETKYWSISYNWSDKQYWTPAPNQIAEKDITIIYTVNAQKNGTPVTLTFKVRNTLITARNNQGMYQIPFVDTTYYIDGNGKITKLRLK